MNITLLFSSKVCIKDFQYFIYDDIINIHIYDFLYTTVPVLFILFVW